MRYIIRAVPERKDEVEYLKQRLPCAEFVMDNDRNAMNTFLRALQEAGDDACVHMEEDIILTKEFTKKVEQAIEKMPNVVIQFFSMRKADINIGSRFDTRFMANLCFYLPKGYSKEILDYSFKWDKIMVHPTGYDLMVQDFLNKVKKERYYIHIPSLVEHRIGVSYINKRRSSKRQSKTFENGDTE